MPRMSRSAKQVALDNLLSRQSRDRILNQYSRNSSDRGALIEPYGDIDPEVMVVGYLTKDSFPILKYLLPKVGLTKVWLSDVFKHDTQHRRPTEREYERALWYVEEEQKILQPKVIACVGDINLITFLGEQEFITPLSGHTLNMENYWLVPVPYPTTGIRHRVAQTEHALRLAKTALGGPNAPKGPLTLMPSPFVPQNGFYGVSRRVNA